MTQEHEFTTIGRKHTHTQNNSLPVFSMVNQQHQLSMSAHSGGLKRSHKLGYKRGRKEVFLVPSFTRHQEEKCASECLYMSLSHTRREMIREVRVFGGHIGAELL